MAIVPLTGFNLIITKKYLDDVLHYVLSSGVIEMSKLGDTNTSREQNPILPKLASARKDIKEVFAALNINPKEISFDKRKGLDEKNLPTMEKDLKELLSKVKTFKEREETLLKNIQFYEESIQQMDFFIESDIEFKDFSVLKYVNIKYGKLPVANYARLYNTVINRRVIVEKITERDNYAYVLFFYPNNKSKSIPTIMSALNIEEISLSPDLRGSPTQLKEFYSDKLKENKIELQKLVLEKEQVKVRNRALIQDLYIQLMANLQIREQEKEMGGQGRYYLNSIWVPEEKEKEFIKKLNDLTEETIIFERFLPKDLKGEDRKKVPTITRNPKIFAPFSLVVEMYGNPSYFEVDPTKLLAISFFVMFGMMFGDIGQGSFLLLTSLILGWKFPKLKLGMNLLATLSVSSIIFGFIYGEIFGFHKLPSLWLSPMHDTMRFLTATITVGIILISIGIVINLYNSWKNRDFEEFLFSKNGLSGVWFYWGTLILLAVLGVKINFAFIFFVWVVPIGLMLFKEPLGAIIRKDHKIFHHGITDFAVGSFFELVDTLLGFLSNTLSFVRVAAFALNHVGLFSVVLLMTEMINVPKLDGAIDVLIIVLGNLFIILLEGFIVTIQILRLEYYEIFSRFYNGSGVNFAPLKYKHE